MIENHRNNKSILREGGGTEHLSKQQCDCLKGIFAIFVLMHHVYQHSGLFRNSIIGMIFQALGYLSVAMFFFLSGYGLMSSYISKGNNYVVNFPRKRLLPYYCVIVVLIVIYQLFWLLIGKEFDSSTFIQSFLIDETVIANGWYLQVQLVLYILFYLCFKALKRHKMKGIFIGCALYCIVAIAVGFTTTRYESVFAFALGFLWANYKENIDVFVKRKFVLLLAGSFIIFFVTLLGGNTGILGSNYVRVPVKMLSAVAFVIMVSLLVYVVRVDYPFTRWLGSISLEIYVLQGLFLALFHSQYINIENGWLYCLAVFACTIPDAYFFHPIVRWIYKTVGGGRERKII